MAVDFPSSYWFTSESLDRLQMPQPMAPVGYVNVYIFGHVLTYVLNIIVNSSADRTQPFVVSHI